MQRECGSVVPWSESVDSRRNRSGSSRRRRTTTPRSGRIGTSPRCSGARWRSTSTRIPARGQFHPPTTNLSERFAGIYARRAQVGVVDSIFRWRAVSPLTMPAQIRPGLMDRLAVANSAALEVLNRVKRRWSQVNATGVVSTCHPCTERVRPRPTHEHCESGAGVGQWLAHAADSTDCRCDSPQADCEGY